MQYGSSRFNLQKILVPLRPEDVLEVVVQVLHRRQQERALVSLPWLRLLRGEPGLRGGGRLVPVRELVLLQVRRREPQASRLRKDLQMDGEKLK